MAAEDGRAPLYCVEHGRGGTAETGYIAGVVVMLVPSGRAMVVVLGVVVVVVGIAVAESRGVEMRTMFDVEARGVVGNWLEWSLRQQKVYLLTPEYSGIFYPRPSHHVTIT